MIQHRLSKINPQMINPQQINLQQSNVQNSNLQQTWMQHSNQALAQALSKSVRERDANMQRPGSLMNSGITLEGTVALNAT